MSKMNKPIYRNSKGFTLIEGLIALAIFAIFIPLFYFLNSYIDQSFSIASRQSDLQFYARLAQIKIKDEISFVNYIEILPSKPTIDDFTSNTVKAVYINADHEIVFVTINGEGVMVETPLVNDMPDDIEMALSFEKITEEDEGTNLCGDRLLEYTISISSKSSGDVFNLESSLLIKDTNDDELNNLSIAGESGIAIIYD